MDEAVETSVASTDAADPGVTGADVAVDTSQEPAAGAEPTAISETPDSQTEATLPEWAQKGWGRVNPLIAELTGKAPDEIAKMSLADRIQAAQTTYAEKLEKLANLEA